MPHKSPARLLIVQTAGEITWDSAINDFDWTKTDAMPEVLSGAFREEPRWVDARFARTEKQVTLRDPRFRDLVAEVAAPVRGIPKDDLIGEDIRQHRRLNFWRNAGVSLLTALLIIATSAAVIAFQQRQTAVLQRNVAEERLKLAQRNESRALASLAESEVERSPATAVRLALAALPIRLDWPDRAYAREAEGALLYSLQNLRERQRFHSYPSLAVAFSADGRTVATGSSEDKTARLWEVATRQEIGVLRGHEQIVSSVAFSADRRTLATGSWDNTARLWEMGQELIDLACARVRFLPLSDKDRQRFGITKEWCTPGVSAELRAKLRLDEAQNNLGSGL